MTRRSIFPVGLLALGLLVQPTSSQTADQFASQPESAVLQPDQLSLSVQAIEQAPDPSAAVAAYARGVALDPSSRKLLEVYVNRMVDFGLPEVAYRQALVLVQMDPSNGQAWAVLSHASARRGQMAEALARLVQAASREPDDKFIQSTAGELLAWYDRNRAIVPNSLKDSLERIRQQMAGQKAYADAYKQATSELSQTAGTQQPMQSATQQQYDNASMPLPSSYVSGFDYSPDYSLYPGFIYYPGYYPYYSSIYYPPYYCPPSCASINGWWGCGPFFGPTFFFGFNHHHFFDRDDFFFHDPFFSRRFDFDDFQHRFGFDRFNRGVFERGRVDHDHGFFADRGRDGFSFGDARFHRDARVFGSSRDASSPTFSQQGRNNVALSQRIGLAAPRVDNHNVFRSDVSGSRIFRSGAIGEMQTNISSPLISMSGRNTLAMRGFGGHGSSSASRSFNPAFSGFSSPSMGASSLGALPRSFDGSTPMSSFSGVSSIRSFGNGFSGVGDGFRGGGGRHGGGGHR